MRTEPVSEAVKVKVIFLNKEKIQKIRTWWVSEAVWGSLRMIVVYSSPHNNPVRPVFSPHFTILHEDDNDDHDNHAHFLPIFIFTGHGYNINYSVHLIWMGIYGEHSNMYLHNDTQMHRFFASFIN